MHSYPRINNWKLIPEFATKSSNLEDWILQLTASEFRSVWTSSQETPSEAESTVRQAWCEPLELTPNEDILSTVLSLPASAASSKSYHSQSLPLGTLTAHLNAILKQTVVLVLFSNTSCQNLLMEVEQPIEAQAALRNSRFLTERLLQYRITPHFSQGSGGFIGWKDQNASRSSRFLPETIFRDSNAPRFRRIRSVHREWWRQIWQNSDLVGSSTPSRIKLWWRRGSENRLRNRTWFDKQKLYRTVHKFVSLDYNDVEVFIFLFYGSSLSLFFNMF